MVQKSLFPTNHISSSTQLVFIPIPIYSYIDTDSSEATTTLRYLLSLYYVSNVFTTTGFNDISARTNIELAISTVMMFGTIFAIGYLVGEMAQCLTSQLSTKIHYQHKLTVLHVIKYVHKWKLN